MCWAGQAQSRTSTVLTVKDPMTSMERANTSFLSDQPGAGGRNPLSITSEAVHPSEYQDSLCLAHSVGKKGKHSVS